MAIEIPYAPPPPNKHTHINTNLQLLLKCLLMSQLSSIFVQGNGIISYLDNARIPVFLQNAIDHSNTDNAKYKQVNYCSSNITPSFLFCCLVTINTFKWPFSILQLYRHKSFCEIIASLPVGEENWGRW